MGYAGDIADGSSPGDGLMIRPTGRSIIRHHEILCGIADYLTAAGDYMARYHKCNRIAGTPDGRVCALGAICKVTPWSPTTIRSDVITAFLAFLGVASIPDWSDESTESEVIQAFYDAAVKFRPDEMIVSRTAGVST
jgi:hypothetical protein